MEPTFYDVNKRTYTVEEVLEIQQRVRESERNAIFTGVLDAFTQTSDQGQCFISLPALKELLGKFRVLSGRYGKFIEFVYAFIRDNRQNEDDECPCCGAEPGQHCTAYCLVYEAKALLGGYEYYF